MSGIRKSDYIEVISSMIDMTNEELKKYAVDSFISCGPADEVVDFYRIKSIKFGVCSIRKFLFSTAIETLEAPSMLVEPIAQKYFDDWRNVKGAPQKDIIEFHRGGKGKVRSNSVWIMPSIEPFYKWRSPQWGEAGNGKIERAGGSYTSIRKVDNLEIVEVLKKVKISEQRRSEEAIQKRQKVSERERQAQLITKNAIDDLLKSL